jgi:cytochrome c peroxidase
MSGRPRGAVSRAVLGALILAGSGACADEAAPGSGGGSSSSQSSVSDAAGAGGEGDGGAAVGGGGAFAYEGPPLPWPFEPFPEAPIPESDPVTPEKAQLGRMLFYDPILSADQATACMTCHSEQWGLSDGLATSIGVHGDGPVGPGRTGPTTTPRNAPTLWNIVYRTELFWDGRRASLEEQALDPMINPIELGLLPADAVDALAEVREYVDLFRAAFPDEEEPLSEATVARALAALQRTFVTKHAPYDQYTQGDVGAVDEEAKRGMELFAEAGCAGCHVPPLFHSDTYADRGVGDGSDPGRGDVTGEASDLGAFKVPTLRNIRDSEPYFHDGSVMTLEDAVDHEVDVQIDRGESRELDEAERAAIARFLKKSLQDTSESPERPREVPSGLPIPEDGFRIPR